MDQNLIENPRDQRPEQMTQLFGLMIRTSAGKCVQLRKEGCAEERAGESAASELARSAALKLTTLVAD